MVGAFLFQGLPNERFHTRAPQIRRSSAIFYLGPSKWGSPTYSLPMASGSPDDRQIGAIRRDRHVAHPVTVGSPRFWNGVAIALGLFITVAGAMHFVRPSFFDAIVPPWLGPSERFWTLASGVAELIVGPLLLIPRTRRVGGIAAVVLFIAVYPANLYMVWDWRDRSFGERFISWARLPFQFVFIWLAWNVSKMAKETSPASQSGGDQ